jgi:hypothetical protein
MLCFGMEMWIPSMAPCTLGKFHQFLHFNITTSIFCPIGHEIRLLNIMLIVLTTLHIIKLTIDLLMANN